MKFKLQKNIFSLLVMILIFLSGCTSPQQFKTDLFSSLEHESQVGPTGLAWDGKNLIMGAANQILFARNIVTDPFHSFSKHDTFLNGGNYSYGRLPITQGMDINICGMAWEGECCGEGFLWIADAKNDLIIKMKPDLTSISQFKSPIPAPNGIAFDGKALWIISKHSYKIVKFNIDMQSIENVYYSPIKRPAGLTWDCSGDGYLWVVGIDDCRTSEKRCYTARLVRIDAKTGVVTHEAKLPEAVTRPSSVTLAEKHFWVGDYNLNRVFKIPFDEKEFIELDLRPSDIISGKIPKPLHRQAPVEEVKVEGEGGHR